MNWGEGVGEKSEKSELRFWSPKATENSQKIFYNFHNIFG